MFRGLTAMGGFGCLHAARKPFLTLLKGSPGSQAKMLQYPDQSGSCNVLCWTPRRSFTDGKSPSLARKHVAEWKNVERLLTLPHGTPMVEVDGESLDVMKVVVVSKYKAFALLSEDNRADIQTITDHSIQVLKQKLQNGDSVYGVNTGFGGSADVKTTDVEGLQRSLVQFQVSGILSSADSLEPFTQPGPVKPAQAILNSRDLDKEYSTQSLPVSWVRGSMVIRCNSLMQGNSAVRLGVVEAILHLLNLEITPVIPANGSISASGDLQPLSYLAAVLQGNEDIFVRCGRLGNQIMTAKEALEAIGMKPLTLAAKEGLGLVNGTATSAAAAALAINESQQMAHLSQILTGMAVEAMGGSAGSFHPFISKVRPHQGQKEVAQNILGFLQGSGLAQGLPTTIQRRKPGGLHQDRYALRTSSQWVGPCLEDLNLAQDQISVELNSTTDNPLIDVVGDTIHSGGNFQAQSLTSAMEKTRFALQTIGQMLFAQATELINPAMNNGLPPNLAADDPSCSFTCKGIDINMAAYMSELGYVANRVSHIQSAEMHNQAINSLALISARKTHDALTLLSKLAASYLYVLCQALDLRVLQAIFLERAERCIKRCVKASFASMLPAETDTDITADDKLGELAEVVWSKMALIWDSTTSLDLRDRARKTADASIIELVQFFAPLSLTVDSAKLASYTRVAAGILEGVYSRKRQQMFENHITITPKYLGLGAKRMYSFVRGDMRIPMHRGLRMEEVDGRTIGTQISVLYEALRDGRVASVVWSVVGEVDEGAIRRPRCKRTARTRE